MIKIILVLIFISSVVFADILKLRTLKNGLVEITTSDKNWIFEDEKYKNKNVLLFFFGTLCPYCIKELPMINDLDLKYDNFEILGIHAQHEISDKDLEVFIAKHEMPFDVLSFDDGMRIISKLDQLKMWMGAVPFNVSVDQNGSIKIIDVLKLESNLIDQIYKSKPKFSLADQNGTFELIDSTKVKVSVFDKNDTLKFIDISKIRFYLTDKNGTMQDINISEVKFKMADKNITKNSKVKK